MNVTEQDIAKAIEVLWPLTRYRQPRDDEWDDVTRGQRDRVAQALADERERARAPFLALAESWEQAAQRMTVLDARKMLAAAKDIRTAAEESQ